MVWPCSGELVVDVIPLVVGPERDPRPYLGELERRGSHHGSWLGRTRTPTSFPAGVSWCVPGRFTAVMQRHVLGMFVPSFFTGYLIARFGHGRVLLPLLLLGIGWSFLFVGGSALLATTHTPAGRGKLEGLNELVIFTPVRAATSLHPIP